MVKEADPDVFWTYPPVALSTTFADANPATEQARAKYVFILIAISLTQISAYEVAPLYT